MGGPCRRSGHPAAGHAAGPPASATMPHRADQPLRIALPIATLLALVLLVDQIRTRPRTERQASAAPDAV